MHYAYRPHFLFRTLFLLLLLLTRKKGELDDEHVDKVGSQHGQYEGPGLGGSPRVLRHEGRGQIAQDEHPTGRSGGRQDGPGQNVEGENDHHDAGEDKGHLTVPVDTDPEGPGRATQTETTGRHPKGRGEAKDKDEHDVAGRH